MTDNFTLGYRLEGGKRIVSGGPALNLVLARVGELEIQAAASRGDDVKLFDVASRRELATFSHSSPGCRRCHTST